jgi:hypothetical protein
LLTGPTNKQFNTAILPSFRYSIRVLGVIEACRPIDTIPVVLTGPRFSRWKPGPSALRYQTSTR